MWFWLQNVRCLTGFCHIADLWCEEYSAPNEFCLCAKIPCIHDTWKTNCNRLQCSLRNLNDAVVQSREYMLTVAYFMLIVCCNVPLLYTRIPVSHTSMVAALLDSTTQGRVEYCKHQFKNNSTSNSGKIIMFFRNVECKLQNVNVLCRILRVSIYSIKHNTLPTMNSQTRSSYKCAMYGCSITSWKRTQPATQNYTHTALTNYYQSKVPLLYPRFVWSKATESNIATITTPIFVS